MTAETITAADTRINARWLIPVEPFGVILEHQAVILQGSRILAIVPQAEADQSYRTRESLDLNNHVVLPGLINLHGHTAMKLGAACHTALIRPARREHKRRIG